MSPILGGNAKRVLFLEKPEVSSGDSDKDLSNFEPGSNQVKPEVSNSDSDEDWSNFEPGSNKWECEQLISTAEPVPSSPLLDMNRKDFLKPASSSKSECSSKFPMTSPDNRPPACQTEKIRHSNESRRMTNNPVWNKARQAVSSKIRGVKRRQLPGWDCDKCSQYYAAAGLVQANINCVSRHRSSHKRLPSPKGYWSLSSDEQCKKDLPSDNEENPTI
ncbi:DNA endonuclease ctp1 [Frankliniella fusca]|uniref:DNA endonuclease ctp1 n=1 Tax=Frankliniella fusca TaxID=407009 RepID=A0AAE1LB80_9NEOP|nr:DNA endonuclease ctp1 [Frankliniella fusca]